MKETLVRIIDMTGSEDEAKRMQGYTTKKRWEHNRTIFSPSTFKHSPYTRHAWGEPLPGAYKHADLVRFAKERPEAYMHWLVDDGHSVAWLQMKSVYAIVTEEIR